ncbi:MAG: hypothetical protein PHH06_02080 [Candidatus Gracilibacteria bacterium]|nr:hypothetical protein [Candidatus Gracilibacteria bacterium]
MLKPSPSITFATLLFSMTVLTACNKNSENINQVLEGTIERITTSDDKSTNQNKIQYYQGVIQDLYRLANIIQKGQTESGYTKLVTGRDKEMLFSQEEYRKFYEDYEMALQNAFILLSYAKNGEEKSLIIGENFGSVIQRFEHMAFISEQYLSQK